ncbi:hypothetical protein NIES4101_61710 [Calothrix sp. NIES-4101]|nr:hypothetical protein NIES4101_61710 [Calothrix sp. NIES-4101]
MSQIFHEISKLLSATNLGKKQAFLILHLDPHRTAEKELRTVEQYNWNETRLT